jgi:hypothetical protein
VLKKILKRLKITNLNKILAKNKKGEEFILKRMKRKSINIKYIRGYLLGMLIKSY